MASKIALIVLFVVAAVVITSAFDFNDLEKRQDDMLEDAIDLFSQHVAEKRGRRFSICKHPFGYTCWCDKKFKGKEKYYRVCDFASGTPIDSQQY